MCSVRQLLDFERQERTEDEHELEGDDRWLLEVKTWMIWSLLLEKLRRIGNLRSEPLAGPSSSPGIRDTRRNKTCTQGR